MNRKVCDWIGGNRKQFQNFKRCGARNCAIPADLRAAPEHNDETLERISIGRRFKNGIERLEKLFDLYTKMTAPREERSEKEVSTAFFLKNWLAICSLRES